MRWRDGDAGAWRFTTSQMSTAVQWNLLAATFEDTGSSYTVKLWKNGSDTPIAQIVPVEMYCPTTAIFA